MTSSPPSASQRLLRSYGPLLGVALAFVIMAASVSALPRERVELAGAAVVPNVGVGGTGRRRAGAAGTDAGRWHDRRGHGRDGRRPGRR